METDSRVWCGEGREFGYVDPAGASRLRIGDIGEPFDFGCVGEIAIMNRCQGSLGNRNQPELIALAVLLNRDNEFYRLRNQPLKFIKIARSSLIY